MYNSENTESKKIKIISVYARVSTSAQEVQETIKAQLLQIKQFAEEHGYTIVKEYLDDGWSGDILARPALDQLRLDARKKMWDAVLIYDPDRLGRRYFYQELVMDELKQLGIETLFVTVPPVKDLNDRLLGGMRGLFAEYERAKISERFRIGKINKLNNGHIVGAEGPYGYTHILNSGKKGSVGYVVGHYIINEEEAKNITMIFKWVADEGYTLRDVVRKLQEEGIKPRRSKRGVWTTGTLGKLLRNETFIGNAHWGATYAVIPDKPFKKEKYRKNKKSSRRIKPQKEWLHVKVPRIIDDDLFYRTGKKLQENFANMGRNRKNDYLLAGKIWCICGQRRAGEGPQKGKYLYYRCTDRVHTFPLPATCLEKGVNAKIADEVVWQNIKELMSNPELMKQQVLKWMEQKKSDSKRIDHVDIDSLKREISKLQEREKKYTNIYSEGIITIEQFKDYILPLQTKISNLKKDLSKAEIDITAELDIAPPTKEELESFAKLATETLDTLSLDVKKAIISKTIEKVTATQKDLQVFGYINLNQIYVKSQISYRDSRITKCGEIDFI